MKKLIIVGVFMFAFVLTANFAFAGFGFNMPSTMQNNVADNVNNGNYSSASTGGNGITQTCVRSGSASIYTGAAGSSTTGVAALNTNVALNGGATQGNMAKYSSNTNESAAGTGVNGITQKKAGGSAIVSTGGASSWTKGISLMNSNISVGCPCTSRPSHPSCGSCVQ